METNNFIKLKCTRCGNTQITYGRATLWVKCKRCNKLLLRPQGGKAKLKAFVKNVFK